MNKQILARQVAKEIIRKKFLNDYGQPFEATDSQADIFLMITLRMFPRNLILSYTQFGKTDVVSMALIVRSQEFHEMWTIVAGKKSKGMLIMNRVIQHVFDESNNFETQLQLDKNEPLDRLKRERSRDKITWLGGGGIRILSAQTGNRNAIKEALIGEGGQNIIEEEAPHIADDVQAMVMRMLIGHQDTFLLKIGNAFNRNHYFKSFNSEKYNKIVIDYHKGLAEGRITQEQIDEVKELPFFSELYECKFPDEDAILEGGYRKLITDEMLEEAFISHEEFEKLCITELKDESGNVVIKVPSGVPKLGGDFAGGGNDRSAYVIRWDNVMRLLDTNKIADTMQQIPIIEHYYEDYDIEDYDIAVDSGGLGKGVGDRLWEKDINVNRVMFGSSAPDTEKSKYKNMRAYMYYQLFNWLKNGGKIVRDDRFFELLVINYKEDSERKFQIQPKEDLKKIMKEVGLVVTSPDVADAAVLTFADNSEVVGEDDFIFA